MGISTKMQDVLNKQLNLEFYSAYAYLSMSAYLESINLKGFAGWMMNHSSEEMVHAMKIYHYILDRDGEVKLAPIAKVPQKWKSVLAAVEDAYKHEKVVTKSIYDLVGSARKENDVATEVFLQWFITEQVEEEKITQELGNRIKMVGESKQALMMFDMELGKGTVGAEEKKA